MSGNKLIAAVGLALVIVTMMTSSPLSIYASPTTEDDGYTYPDDASEEEKEEIDEQEQEAWEDAGRPGDNDDNDENGDDNTKPNPYCDKRPADYHGPCHDRKDSYQGGAKHGLYPCNDGTDKKDWRDCKDASGLSSNRDTSSGNNDNDNDIPECQNGVTQECVISEIGLICSPGYDLSNPSIVGGGHACQDIYVGTYEPESESESELKTCKDGTLAMSCGMIGYATGSSNAATTETITPLPTSTTETTAADASNCKLDGSADGIQQKFDSVKYQACGLYLNSQKAYSDGFITGCTQVGNTQVICQALVDSSIQNAKIQPTQTKTQTVTQPTQAIQSAAVDTNNCRSSGFEDGMNSGFNVNTWAYCGGSEQLMYYEGFVIGCTYYDAFTVDYCENWANGSIK